jgi:deoxyribodipyrimidine photo-lyase
MDSQVYSPYQRNWLTILNANIPYYLEDCTKPDPNTNAIYASKILAALFETPVPLFVPGFELQEADRRKMGEVWPAGEDAAHKVCL